MRWKGGQIINKTRLDPTGLKPTGLKGSTGKDDEGGGGAREMVWGTAAVAAQGRKSDSKHIWKFGKDKKQFFVSCTSEKLIIGRPLLQPGLSHWTV